LIAKRLYNLEQRKYFFSPVDHCARFVAGGDANTAALAAFKLPHVPLQHPNCRCRSIKTAVATAMKLLAAREHYAGTALKCDIASKENIAGKINTTGKGNSALAASKTSACAAAASNLPLPLLQHPNLLQPYHETSRS